MPQPPTDVNAGSFGSSISDRTIEAARWRSGSYLAQAVLQFGVGVALARLLLPQEFGLAALAMVFVGFVSMLAELGMSAALVYRQPLTERHIRVAFTSALLVAAALGTVTFLLAPYVAVLLQNQSLPGVLRAESFLFILSAPAATAGALLRRALDFRRLFIVEVGGYILGYAVVAASLAALGFGVWSLVCGVLAQAAVSSGLAFALHPHSVRPLLAVEEAREVFGYGGAATLNSIVSYAARTADSFIVGRWLGPAALGLYARAANAISVPLAYLGNTATGVLFPAMAEIRSDPSRFRTAYLFGVQVTTLIAAPICAGILVAGPHLIVGLYGETWRGAALPLQIFAAAGVFRAVFRLAAAVTYASGNIIAEVRRQLISLGLVLVGGILGSSWGLAGVTVGIVVATGFMYVAMSRLSLNITGSAWGPFFLAQVPGVILGLEVGIVALAVRWTLEGLEVGSLGILLAIVVACAATLPVGVFLLPRRYRPAELFARFKVPISRLPVSVRSSLQWMLRLEA